METGTLENKMCNICKVEVADVFCAETGNRNRRLRCRHAATVLDQVKRSLLLFSVFVAFTLQLRSPACCWLASLCTPYFIQLICPQNNLSFNTGDMEINLSNSQLWREATIAYRLYKESHI